MPAYPSRIRPVPDASDLAIVLLSLKVAVVATLASTPIAVAMALVLARKRFWGRSLINAIVHLPLVMPPVVTGYVLLVLLGRRGPVGAVLERTLGLTFAFRWTGAAVAAAVMGFPLMVRAIRLPVEHVDPHLEDAARSLGANRWWTTASVTLPLALPGILSGMMLAFAKALGEFGATITFVSNIPGETRTLALAIYTFTQTPGADVHIWRLAGLSVAISFAALIVSEALARRLDVSR
jgi:molybdate transport system permease protein